MRLRLGINTCFAVKRWPETNAWLRIVRDRLGLALIQHSLDLIPDGSSDASAEALGADIRGTGGDLHSTFTGLAAYSGNLLLHPDPIQRARAEAWFGWAIRYTAAAGGRATGGHVGAFTVADWTHPSRRTDRWAGLQAALARLGANAHAAGLDHLLVENLAAAREPSTMAMVNDLLSEGDAGHAPIRLCLDVGHMCVPGTVDDERDPYAWLRRYGRAASVIQIQQSDADGDHHWPFTSQRNRTGRIDADRVVDALAEGGAQDIALILEIIPPFEQADRQVLADLEASAGYWHEALSRRGVLG